MGTDDSSMEFDLFEDARRTLAEFFMSEGRAPLEAERIASYIIQGVRGVPKLLMTLNDAELQDKEQVRSALNSVLDNASAFLKAKNIILGTDDGSVH